MPHKRAKRSAREQVKKQTGSDLAPATAVLSKEPIPKSVARVLNAAKVQEEWREKKRKSEEDPSGQPKDRKKRRKTSEDAGEDTMKIHPGESLGHFNRRVESSLRGTVRDAMQVSAAHGRKAKKEAEEAKKAAAASKSQRSYENTTKSKSTAVDAVDSQSQKERNGPTEFTAVRTSAPRRLNDIVQAPPELKKLPRGAKSKHLLGGREDGPQSRSLRDGALTMARKAMLEEERKRAVRMYREMKKQNIDA